MNLIFIKDWGTFKIGDIVENPTAVTKKALVETYKVAKRTLKRVKKESDQNLDTVMHQEIKQIEEETEISVKKAPQRRRHSTGAKRKKHA